MIKLSLKALIVIAALSAAFAVAPRTSANDKGAKDKSAKEVTFARDVAPILYKNCAACHRPNDIAPMSLLTYKDARPWARSIKEKVVTRQMPPWSADPHYGRFANETRLSEAEIATLAAWVDQGAKEGNPKDLPPAPDFNANWEVGKPDVVLSMADEYTVAAEGADEYLYFRVATNFTEDKWVQAAEFRPGNKRIVHHAVVFIETPDLVAASKRAAERNGQGAKGQVPIAFETTVGSLFIKEGSLRRIKPTVPVVDDLCGSPDQGHSLGSTELLCVYAPGRNADVWPAGTAKLIPAGSNLIFQMHYSKTTGKAEKDRTSLALVFAKTPVEKMITTRDVSNLFFKIPAGAENHQVTSCYTFPRDVELVNYMPHMHIRGKDMKYEAVYPDGRRETLLAVPQYDFNWQTLYKLKEPVQIPKGTKIIVTAHFDNSEKNRRNPDPKRDVRYGEPTYDEMMVGFMDYLVPKPRARVVAKLDAKTLDAYVGQYTLGMGPAFTVTKEEDHLLVEFRGQQINIYPESETKFFLKAIDGDITFVKNEKGEVTEMVFDRSGRVVRAKRMTKPDQSAGNK